MHVAILIKILLEITCLILCMRHVVQTIVYFSMNLEIIHSVFKPIFEKLVGGTELEYCFQ